MLKDEQACRDFVNIVNIKDNKVGIIIMSGTCMPDYSNIIILV